MKSVKATQHQFFCVFVCCMLNVICFAVDSGGAVSIFHVVYLRCQAVCVTVNLFKGCTSAACVTSPHPHRTPPRQRCRLLVRSVKTDSGSFCCCSCCCCCFLITGMGEITNNIAWAKHLRVKFSFSDDIVYFQCKLWLSGCSSVCCLL